MRYFVTIAGRTYDVVVGPDGTTLDGAPVAVDVAHIEGTDVRSLILDGRSYRAVVHRNGTGAWDVHLRGRRLVAEALDERTYRIREMTGASAAPVGPEPVRAPMPGLVVKVEVEEGDRVEAGQGIVIVESMKMENELRAEAAGVVERIHVRSGQPVERGQVLVDLAAPEDGPDEDGPGEKS